MGKQSGKNAETKTNKFEITAWRNEAKKTKKMQQITTRTEQTEAILLFLW